MTVLSATALLAASADGKASGIGLVVILGLIAACVFLFRSLNKQLRKLPPTFDATEPPRLPEPADPADDALAATPADRSRADDGAERADHERD